MRNGLIATIGALALGFLSGCGGSGGEMAAPADQARAAGGCSDGTAPLAGTGLCQKAASALINRVGSIDDEPSWVVPEGCIARINETAMPGGEYLLYTASSCQGVTAQLAFEGGARTSELKLKTSTFGAVPADSLPVVLILGSDATDPTGNLLAFARAAITDPADAAGCSVRAIDIPGYPADGYVVDVSADLAAAYPQDEIRSACGPFGLDQGVQAYWRVFQGFSWFFSLGQDTPEFDPATLTVVRRNAAGVWAQAS